MTIGIWLTPIMWNITRIADNSVLHFVFRLNPVYYVVQGYRDTLISHIWVTDRWMITGYFWGVVLLCGLIGYFMYKRLKPHFSDVL